MTLYLHRLIIVCPLARIAALGTWWAANIDPTDNCSTWPALNPSGDPANPVTHRWCSTALTAAQLRLIIARVCSLASVAPPTVATWNGWTRAEKRAWLGSTRDSLFAATGIWLDLSDGDGQWNDPAAALARIAIKRRQRTSP